MPLCTISLYYLSKNNAKYWENYRFNSIVGPTYSLCAPMVQESVLDNVKGGRDGKNTAHLTQIQ